MNANILNFLTTDGAISVTFPERLNPSQYQTLYELIQQKHYSTSELCAALRQVANEWGV